MLAGALHLLAGRALIFFGLMFMSTVEGGSIFAQVQQATTVDTMYFSFTTLSTVGYGDLTPCRTSRGWSR